MIVFRVRKRRVAVAATPSAASATSAAASPPAWFTGLSAFGRTVSRRLGGLRPLVVVYVACLEIILAVRDWLLGRRLLRQAFALARVTVAATSSSASSPAGSVVATPHRLCFRAIGVLIGFLADFFRLFDLIMVFVVLDRRDNRRGLTGDRSCLFNAVNLLPSFYAEWLLATHRGIGIDGEGDAETILELAQMGALVVEHIERDLLAGAHEEIVGRAA
jgi:hypothetical protein